jgi:hypothetical protein
MLANELQQKIENNNNNNNNNKSVSTRNWDFGFSSCQISKNNYLKKIKKILWLYIKFE